MGPVCLNEEDPIHIPGSYDPVDDPGQRQICHRDGPRIEPPFLDRLQQLRMQLTRLNIGDQRTQILDIPVLISIVLEADVHNDIKNLSQINGAIDLLLDLFVIMLVR